MLMLEKYFNCFMMLVFEKDILIVRKYLDVMNCFLNVEVMIL